MTKEEFLELDYGDILTAERYPGEVYEVYDNDVFIVGDRGREYRVLGARDKATKKEIRIDMQNYPVWNVKKEGIL
ncbi:hypothetical protein SAMN02910370_02745 [Lachnospiraceae bacterium XPB1003]|nr:hypothetical protein SAMN02910370_02745 [Lachnospiraceae bacterium XPB1003]